MIARPLYVPDANYSTRGGKMWIEAEGPAKLLVQVDKLDTIYLKYKSHGNWAALGTIRDRDIHLKTFACEADGVSWIDELLRNHLS